MAYGGTGGKRRLAGPRHPNQTRARGTRRTCARSETAQAPHRRRVIMALTAIDQKTALIIIDLQKGIVGLPTAHPTAEVVRHARTLADAFRRYDLPIVLVNVAGGAPGRAEQTRSTQGFPAGWTDLVPELNQHPGDHTVTKQTWGAFTNTGLN